MKHGLSPAWVAGVFLAALGIALVGTAWNVSLFRSINDAAPAWDVLGSWGSVLGLGAFPLVAAACRGPRRPHALAAVLLALLVCGGMVQILKFILDEARPLAVLGIGGMHVVGAHLQHRAMPSGHAAAGACAATMLWYACRISPRRIPLAALATVLAVVEAVSRVLVGAHWPSDVFAGAGIGVLAGAIVCGTAWGERFRIRLTMWMRAPAGPLVVAIVLALASLSLWSQRHDYPLALGLYVALAGLGWCAALWWLLPQAAVRRAVAAVSVRAQ